MVKRYYLKLLLVLALWTIATKLLIVLILEPLVREKIESTVNDKVAGYQIEIGEVNLSIICPGIQLKRMVFLPVQDSTNAVAFTGKLETLSIRGVNLLKIVLTRDIDIFKISMVNGHFNGEFTLPEESKPASGSPFNIRVATLELTNIEGNLRNSENAQSFAVSRADLKMKGLHIEREDLFSLKIVQPFGFRAAELVSVSPDSMYTFTASEVLHSSASQKFSVKRFLIEPNYPDYEFTSRHRYETDRIDASLTEIIVHDFNAEDYFTTDTLAASYLEIGNMEVDVFRDKREAFKHVDKLPFQEMIHRFPGTLNIDSLEIKKGNIVYTEHAEKAEEAGVIRFNDLQAKIYHITNDSVHENKDAFFELDASALLMGRGKLSILLKARLFDPCNTFRLNGQLSCMAVERLNPMLTHNAFMEAKSGTIESMEFDFTANNLGATGTLTVLYKNLDVKVLDKQEDENRGLKEWILSILANSKILDSNPLPDEEVREGVIKYERDPERFLFNYAFKSILTGIEHSLSRDSKE